jgi:hypothetical protein
MTMAANDAMTMSGGPISHLSRTAARVAFASGLASILLLLALHVLKPDLDPSWHMLSEYALGEHGWVMALFFILLSLACASLLVALLPFADTMKGRIGLLLLAASAVGLAMAAIYPMDPINVPPESASHSGRMHGVSAMIGMPGMILAAIVLAFALRSKPLWAPRRGPLMTMAHLTWIGAVLMAVLMTFLIQQGLDGPGGYVGWANRLLVLAFCGWLLITARPLARSTG